VGRTQITRRREAEDALLELFRPKGIHAAEAAAGRQKSDWPTKGDSAALMSS